MLCTQIVVLSPVRIEDGKPHAWHMNALRSACLQQCRGGYIKLDILSSSCSRIQELMNMWRSPWMMMMMLGDVVEVMLLLVIMEDRAAGSSCSPAATAAVLIDEEPSMWSLMKDINKIFYQQQVLSSHPFTSLCVSACCCIGVSSLQVWRHPC